MRYGDLRQRRSTTNWQIRRPDWIIQTQPRKCLTLEPGAAKLGQPFYAEHFMQISEHKVVTLNYEVVDYQGQLIDRSEEGGPLAYIHGTGQLIPGLETALADRGQGDKISVDVPPEQGYGERDEEGVQTVSRDQFDDDDEIEVGMQFEAQDDEGHQIVTVVAVDGESITLDTNHPLAGKNLHFDVEVLEVRDASAEELEHGHVHGPGGHEH